MGNQNDDKQLMIRFGRRGDREAFEQLVRRWDRRVLSFLAKAGGDLEAAEDLRQEVFLRLYRHGRRYDPRYGFSTWLFRIAGNVLKSWQTRQTRRERLGGEGLAGGALTNAGAPVPDPRKNAEAAEARACVRTALGRLSMEQRELLLLRFDLELSYREIGRLKQMPETTVKSRIYALLRHLRQEMSGLEQNGLKQNGLKQNGLKQNELKQMERTTR